MAITQNSISTPDGDAADTTGQDTKTPAKKSRSSAGTGGLTVPQNKIIRSVTEKYLADLDLADLPSAEAIETDLINQVNFEFDAENIGRATNNKIFLLKKLSCSQVAQILLRLHHVVRIAPSGKNTNRDYDLLGIYSDQGSDKGIYQTSEDSFRSVARSYNYDLSTNDFKEIQAAMADGAPRAHCNTDRDLIAVQNGIFDYHTKTLRDFTPATVFTSKSQVAYNSQAQNVTITHPIDKTEWDVETWMLELTDDPEIGELLWEILGAIIRPHVRWGKAAWFYSETGNNGKGTLCELMRELTGPSSFASIQIPDFGKDFLLEPLIRASAIIVDENDVGTFIDKAANLKAIITNDVISMNRKNKPPIAFQFWGFMVQCLNGYPRAKDKSESFYRRQLFVPFSKSFTGAERKYIKEEYLGRQDVLEYVLQRVLHMNYYELSEPEATKDVLEEYKLTNDPIRAFFGEFEDHFVWDLLPFQFLYDLYRAWFTLNSPSGSPIGRNGFIKEVAVIAKKSNIWFCDDTRRQIRPGSRLSTPEPLIITYDLKGWMNKAYTGNTVSQRAVPFPLDPHYRGLQRIAPTTVVGSNPDDESDAPTAEPTAEPVT